MGAFNVQEAASAYWLMRERLLALYQTSHAGRYPRLVDALQGCRLPFLEDAYAASPLR